MGHGKLEAKFRKSFFGAFSCRKSFKSTLLGTLILTFMWPLFSRAEIFYEPTFGVAAGKYQELHYSEVRAGLVLSMNDQFLRFDMQGFHRYIDGGENFSGADFGLQVQRWFRLSEKSLLGTRIGPGYRWASNQFDAPFLDFSISAQHLDFFSFRIGYKLLFHELKDDSHENESMVYVSFEI